MNEKLIQLELHGTYKDMLKSAMAGDCLFVPAQMRGRLKEYHRADDTASAEFDETLQQEYVPAVGTDDCPEGLKRVRSSPSIQRILP